MSLMLAIAASASFALLVYLVVALVKPELFS